MERSGAPAEQRSSHAPDGVRGGLPRGVVTALLALVVVAAALAGPWEAGGPTASPLPVDPTTDAPSAPPDLPEEELSELIDQLPPPPFDLGWVGTAVLVLLAVVAGALVVRMLRGRRRDGPAQDAPESRPGAGAVDALDVTDAAVVLHHGAETATARLDAVAAPTDAIVAAWVALEEAADRAGVHRDPVDTPTEFTVAVLDRARADPDATRTLLGLYLRARFSDDALGADDVAAARSALARVARGLAEPAADPSDDGVPSPVLPDATPSRGATTPSRGPTTPPGAAPSTGDAASPDAVPDHGGTS